MKIDEVVHELNRGDSRFRGTLLAAKCDARGREGWSVVMVDIRRRGVVLFEALPPEGNLLDVAKRAGCPLFDVFTVTRFACGKWMKVGP